MFKVVSFSMALFSVLTIILVLYYYFSTTANLTAIKSEVAEIETRLKTQLATLKKDEKLVQSYETLADDVKTINKILKSRAFPWLNTLNRIEESIGECVIDSLSINKRNDSITGKISGLGKDVDAVSSFINRVHAEDSYFRLKINNYRIVDKDGYKIAFTLNLTTIPDWYVKRIQTEKGPKDGN